MRRIYQAMFFKDDDDNTPQGKLARGCFYVFYWILFFVFLFGFVMPVFHWMFGK